MFVVIVIIIIIIIIIIINYFNKVTANLKELNYIV